MKIKYKQQTEIKNIINKKKQTLVCFIVNLMTLWSIFYNKYLRKEIEMRHHLFSGYPALYVITNIRLHREKNLLSNCLIMDKMMSNHSYGGISSKVSCVRNGSLNILKSVVKSKTFVDIFGGNVVCNLA